MAMFEITKAGLEERPAASFADLGLKERSDLQRFLRDRIAALDPDLLVISEEFSNWEDTKRRIDLLALDRDGRLVVIELKRTDDGGHMELQALRYAAMVAEMDFEQVVESYSKHCAVHRSNDDIDAKAEILEFLGHDVGDTPEISNDVRIVLVSADFGKEITTTVLWLNRLDGMDIRCFRLSGYQVGDTVLLDVQQVLPLPEAADYQIRLRRKEAARERSLTASGKDFTRYDILVGGEVVAPSLSKRHAIRMLVAQLVKQHVPPSEIQAILPKSRMLEFAGELTTQKQVEAAIHDAQPDRDLRRWFTNDPFVDSESHITYVLSNQWGTSTESTLETLSTAFAGKSVTFRVAAAD